jgi:hypothetical protein
MVTRSYPLNRRRLPGRAPYVVTALRRKYAELKGKGDSDAMAHVGATLLMFDPAEDLARIAPLRPYKADREHWTRTALDIMRADHTPLRACELARKVKAAHEVPLDDQRRLVTITCALQGTLAKLADQGLVEISGKPRRWALAP